VDSKNKPERVCTWKFFPSSVRSPRGKLQSAPYSDQRVDRHSVARVIFVLLLALNLGTAAWLLWQPKRIEVSPSATDPLIPPLVLLSERDRGAMAQAAELAAEPEPLPVQSVCLSLGPFQTRDLAQSAAAALTPLVNAVDVRATSERSVRGYWVHVPAAATRADALATARQLNAAGIRDNYVITAGSQENHISLGLFKDQQNAEKRRDQVTRLGFRVRVDERVDTREQFWLDLESKDASTIAWQGRVPDAETLSASEQACRSPEPQFPQR